MTLSLALLIIAAAAMVSFATSGLTGLALIFGHRALSARAPAARARVLLGLAVLPMLVTTAVLTAALAPSFGWIIDHCDTSPALSHAHPHICAHHDSVLPGLSISALAAVFLLRALATGARLVKLTASAARARHVLLQQARGRVGLGGAHVLPVDEPQAFVLGVFQPALFVTRGLLRPANRSHLETVLAHERAHLLRGDPMRRLLATIASAFHLPLVARGIERHLACAHEMAADEDAATAIGSRERVARALVHLSRAQLSTPGAALAFAGSDLEARVRSLLETRQSPSGPGPRALMVLATFGLLLVAVAADAVHHGIETLLGLLGA